MKKEKPLPTSAFLKEIGIKSEKTQIKTTSYLAFEALVKEWVENHPGVKPVLVDIGAGQGINVINLEKQGLPVIAVEPVYNPALWKERKPEYAFSSEVPSGIADLIFISYVLNVVSKEIAEDIILDIRRILKPKGKALIFVRSISDIENSAKAYIHPEYGELSWGKGHKVTTALTYQRGFTFESLYKEIISLLPTVTVLKQKTKSGLAVLLIKG